MNVNKAAYEIATLLGPTHEYSVVLFNVLNLAYYDSERLKKPLDLNEQFYNGKYAADEVHLFQLHKAVDYYVHNIEGTFSSQKERPNAILVGTDAGHTTEEKEDEIMGVIQHHAQGLGIDKTLSSKGMLSIKKESDEDYKQAKQRLFDLIYADKKFEEYVPVKFIFLRCVLHSTDKLFITSAELSEYAKACYINSPEEEEQFVDLFHKCCSLIVFPPKSGYVILKLENFLKGIEILYRNRENLNEEDKDQLKYGILSKKVARYFWSDVCGKESVSHYEFYTSVLLKFGLMVEIANDNYFMPSLRSTYDKTTPTATSNSLIIVYDKSLLPFHKQCEFVTYFGSFSNASYKTTLTKCSAYNVIKFDCVDKCHNVEVIITIRFRSDFLELFITSKSACSEDIYIQIYDFLKKSCVMALNNMEFRGLHYNLAIVCPESEKSGLHFIKFRHNETSLLHGCSLDDCKFNGNKDLDSHPAIHWVNTDSQREPDILHPLSKLGVLISQGLNFWGEEVHASSLSICSWFFKPDFS